MVTKTSHMDKRALAALIAFSAIFLALTLQGATGLPNGASILSNASDTAAARSPDGRTDDRGTITVLTIDAINQNQNWKAYVGNISGRLSLDNAAGFTIYDWELSGGSIGGEVYISRGASPDFTNVSCASQGNITGEHPFYNMTDNQADSINNTFNFTSHQLFAVGTIDIGADSCPSTATYVNGTNASQAMDGTQLFQEIVLQDVNGTLIFVSIIDDDEAGYDSNTYDFQMIVPENDVNATATTYYFWTELTG